MHGLLSRTVQIRSLDGPRPRAIEEPSHAHHHAGEDEKQDHACSDRVVRPRARWIGNNQSGPRNGRKQELDQGQRQHLRDIHPVHDHPCLILPRIPMHSAPQPTASFHLRCTNCNPADDAMKRSKGNGVGRSSIVYLPVLPRCVCSVCRSFWIHPPSSTFGLRRLEYFHAEPVHR